MFLERKYSGNTVSLLAAGGIGQRGHMARGKMERDPKGKDDIMNWGSWVPLGH